MNVNVNVTCCGCEDQSEPPVAYAPAPTMIAVLNPLGQGNFSQQVSMFDPVIVNPSPDAQINSYGSSIQYKSNGWYTVSLTCKVTPVDDYDDVYPHGATVYGSHVTMSLEGRSNHARFANTSGFEYENAILRSEFGTESQKVQWHDDFTVEVTNFETQESAIIIYAQKYAGIGNLAEFSGVIKVTKIAPPTPAPVV
jgi:hypothetical protein